MIYIESKRKSLESLQQKYPGAMIIDVTSKLQHLVIAARVIAKNKPVVLLDYNTNEDVNDLSRPLSHAALIKAYINGCYPE